MKQYRWHIFIIIALLWGFITFALESRVNYIPESSINQDVIYDADAEIESARERLSKVEKAEILTGIDTFDKKILITFDGLADRITTRKILKLLDEHKIKGTFFVEGISAAEDEQTVLDIIEAGHEIGNYTLKGQPQMELESQGKVLEDLVLTNEILFKTSGVVPKLVKFNNTKYTDGILETSKAAGFDQVVQSNKFISYQSFKSYDAVKDYIKHLEKGVVLSVKMRGVLSDEEYIETNVSGNEQVNESADASEDSAINESVEAPLEASDDETNAEENDEIETLESVELDKDITQIVEWLLRAMNEEKVQVTTASELGQFHDAVFSESFEAARTTNSGRLANPRRQVKTEDWVVGYVFRGIDNNVNLTNVLNALDKRSIKATFVITGEELKDYPQRVRNIINGGHDIANGGLTGKALIGKSFDEICIELVKTSQILADDYSYSTNLFYPAGGKVDATIKEATSALRYELILYNKNPILRSSTSLNDVENYFKNGVKHGDIVMFNLDQTQVVNRAVDYVSTLTYEQGYNVLSVERLLAYSGSTKPSIFPTYYAEYQQKREKNNGAKSEVIQNVYTSQPAVSYVFRGVKDNETLDVVLKALDEKKIKGSFFITGEEVEKEPQNVLKIINRGHSVYNGGMGYDKRNPSTLNFNEILHEIRLGDEALHDLLGSKYSSSNRIYMPLYGDVGGHVLEAASAYGYEDVVTFNRNPMRRNYTDWSAERITDDYFANLVSLHRGDVVYFHLNHLKDSGVMSDLIKLITERYVDRAAYSVESIGSVIHSDWTYKPAERRKKLRPDELIGAIPEEKIMDYLTEHYIGTPTIAHASDLIGFSEDEIKMLDTKGKIDTKGEKVLFLTFDDWGSDIAISKLLNVLDKHQAKGTFFVRVGNASLGTEDSMNNPNLLRAIADMGHDIGNHTYTHMKTSITSSLEAEQLRNEVLSAKLEMERYLHGTTALKPYFRPPELAVSKLGMSTVINTGYEYVLNGDLSTHDYEAESVRELVKTIYLHDGKTEVSEGSILVMHMSDNSAHTADALDVLIPFYKTEGYKFAKLSDYLK